VIAMLSRTVSRLAMLVIDVVVTAGIWMFVLDAA
jgi:hypothetical protein